MKLWKKIVLILLALLVLVQIPFIYRRYQTGRLAQRIAELQSQRVNREDPQFKEYKGIIHAHTSLGGHSTGGFDELIKAANSNDLDFVLMTEHWADEYDTSALTLNGVYGKTLFVGGNEIDTADGDRFLMIPGSKDAAGLRNVPTTQVLQKLHDENRLALITYPEKFNSWNSDFDGDEVFSNHTELKRANPLLAAGDLIWSYPSYPELTLMSYLRRPDANLQKFDEIASQRKISLFAGTDAHSNIGFHLFGDDTGHKFINIKLDPYATTFGIVRAHVLIPRTEEMTKENLLFALKMGHYFVGFDALGDTSGFSFGAEQGPVNAAMGDELDRSWAKTLGLKSTSPVPARFVVYKNGERFYESQPVTEITINPDQPGEYRVEVYLDQLGSPFDKMPWIISNPIYVR